MKGAGVRDLPRPPDGFPCQFLTFSVQTWAIAWVGQVDPLHGTFRNEPDDSNNQGHIAVVSYQVSRSFA